MHRRVVQRHLRRLIGIFIVHIVNDVHGIHIQPRRPLHIRLQRLHHAVEVEHLILHHFPRRADGNAALGVKAAVECQQQQLRQIAARAEKLHLSADLHRRDTARDRIIVAVERTHPIVVFILDGIGVARHLGAKALEGCGQSRRPQHREVRLGRRAERIERVEHPKARFRDKRSAVLAHAADALGDPHGIAAEQFVIFRRAQMAGKAQLDNEIVDKLLCALLGENARRHVPLDIDVKKRAHPPKRHGGAVLLLDGGKIRKIGPLDRFFRVCRGRGNVKAIAFRHVAQSMKRRDLKGKLLGKADVRTVKITRRQRRLVRFLFRDQALHAIQRHPPIVPDDAPSAIGIG